MPKYPFDGYTRVAVVPAINNLAAPSLAEINAGTDITCDLTADGLRLSREQSTTTRTGWASNVDFEAPTRYGFPNAGLTGFRYTPPEDETLWDLAASFREEAFLVVRRGLDHDIAWATSQVVETYQFQWGKRSVYDSANDTMVTFTVPIHISDDNDAAVVT